MSESTRRKVILHYHVFKNAGTSIDQMLKASLGERWAQWDKEDPGAKISPKEMEEYILDHPDLVAFSSHQVVPPLPSKHLDIYPIVFIRHPIDRAYSAYLFEWKKQKGGSEPVDSFDAYVTQALQHRRKSAIEDFQTVHFANRGYESRRAAADLGDEELLGNAKGFLKSLPLFGIVEKYEQSLDRMQRAWGGIFPEVTFSVFHANMLQDPERSLAQKMSALKSGMAGPVYNELILRNQLDLRLYEYGSACFDMAG